MCKQAVIEIEPIANKICRRISKGQLIGRGGECLRIYQPPSLPFIWIGAFDRLFSLNMDFDPDHEKWQFCCCRILTGLKLWAGVEIVLSLILTVVLASTSYSSVKQNVQVILIFLFIIEFLEHRRDIRHWIVDDLRSYAGFFHLVNDWDVGISRKTDVNVD
jgi:hypothetical protein